MAFFKKIKDGFEELKEDTESAGKKFENAFKSETHSHTHFGHHCHALHHTIHNRFHSFAPPRTDDKVKWFVDGCGYFYAMSVALEEAQHEVWILDWWLSPELYLRRPPSKNQQYRLDRMLQAAAERGVKVNVIVYKEVAAALSLDSIHTKHALEALNTNIAVFRHPDHSPSLQDLASDFRNMFLHSGDLANIPHAIKEDLYGFSDDMVLYWAHHEKLFLVDGKIAFMGGLDACFGRWDTNNHPIADAHPSDLDEIIFPGQDFNNARVFDFAHVDKWQDNKLDRTKASRMGWSDISICIEGAVVEDLRAHFVQRWNYLYNCKYRGVDEGRYHPLSMGHPSQVYAADGSNLHFGLESEKLVGIHANAEPEDGTPAAPGAFPTSQGGHHLFHHKPGGFIDRLESELHGYDRFQDHDVNRSLGDNAGVSVQLCRSISHWSHGMSTEHSIANAYIDVIRDSKHFVYIENQFFITSTDHSPGPVMNKIGAAIVSRILQAAQAGEKYKIIVNMPAVPGFAGDLHAEASLGTLAIMDFQYKSISRGGHSIMEKISQAGFDPNNYISFYNLRNYDRINTSAAMAQAEQQSGVSYEAARKEHDDQVGAGFGGEGEGTDPHPDDPNSQYAKYQQAATANPASSLDTVSASYMLNGPPLTSVPWDGGNTAEIDAYVSEELYIHSKVLIADDRIVICGSANLNDRSQLGYHDSEIAVVIEDTASVASSMAGQPYTAAAFAASLRRHLFRKHLGLLPAQDPTRPDDNFLPVHHAPNAYDWGSDTDALVADPLSDALDRLWRGTARTNTDVFEKVFRPVPSDRVRNWAQYQAYYAQYFVSPDKKDTKEADRKAAKYQYGHVFKEDFPGGVDEVKAELQKIKGTLVEMPLQFLADIKNLAKESFSYNSLTDDLYT